MFLALARKSSINQHTHRVLKPWASQTWAVALRFNATWSLQQPMTRGDVVAGYETSRSLSFLICKMGAGKLSKIKRHKAHKMFTIVTGTELELNEYLPTTFKSR